MQNAENNSLCSFQNIHIVRWNKEEQIFFFFLNLVRFLSGTIPSLKVSNQLGRFCFLGYTVSGLKDLNYVSMIDAPFIFTA